jgi:hypothetical protein
MTITTRLRNTITWIDMIGLEIGLKHKSSRSYQSIPGGTITILILIFIAYCTIYFGEDIYYKEKPISRFNKAMNNNTLINMTQFPVTISFTTAQGALYTNSDRYIQISPYWYLFDWQPLHQSGIKVYPLIVEPCNEEHVSIHKDLFLQESFFSSSFCIKNDKYINGTVEQKGEIFFQNEFGSLNSSIIQYLVQQCTNTTENWNKCASQEDIDTFLSNVNIAYTYVDAYVNLDYYERPYNYYISRNIVALNRKIGKTNIVRVKPVTIKTDSGFILEDPDDISIIQSEQINTDILGETPIMFNLVLTGTRTQDVYYRNYIKVQDIFANVGGLLQFLLTISIFVLEFYQEASFKLDILNNLYEIDNEKVDMKEPKVEIIDELKDVSYQQPIARNNYVRTKPESFEELNLGFIDYIRTYLRCKSKYSKNQYNYLLEFVDSKFEILNYIRASNTLDSLVGILTTSEQRRRVQGKHQLRWRKDGVRSFSHLEEKVISQCKISGLK